MKTQDRSERNNPNGHSNFNLDRQNSISVPPVDKLINDSFESANLLLFEAQLTRSGLLARLEASGVVPKLRNPNPFEPRDQPRHDEWWRDNPERQSDYLQRVGERDKALRQLYVGMHLR